MTYDKYLLQEQNKRSEMKIMTLYEGRGPDDTSKDEYIPIQKLIFHIREKKKNH